jgi:mannose-6-phosphate isomerase-like protein (cupin superfamily)
MDSPVFELIRIGPLTLRYFTDGSGTSGAVDCFEFTVPPQTKGSPPHYHRDVDELVYGVQGRVTFTVAGEDRVLGPRDCTFIPRGAVHGFSNRHDEPAVVLSVMTPGIGPDYFREMAALFASGAPAPAAIAAVMTRHGLIPV